MYKAEDIVNVADDHLGEDYILGAVAPLANPNWRGPWDCAEFVSWCAYQAYGIIFAVRPPDPRDGESYSGWWYDDAISGERDMPVAQALATRGAILVRRPRIVQGKKKIGHVSISLGNGSTIEAKDTATGVAVVTEQQAAFGTSGSRSRAWIMATVRLAPRTPNLPVCCCAATRTCTALQSRLCSASSLRPGWILAAATAISVP